MPDARVPAGSLVRLVFFIAAWCDVHVLFKHSGERKLARIADGRRDLRHRECGGLQQLAGLVDPVLDQIFHRGASGLALEDL